MEESVNSMQAFFDSSLPHLKVTVHLYKSAEVKGLLLGNTHQSHVDFESNQSHIIYNDKYKNNFLQKENAIFLRQLIGEPSYALLENGLVYTLRNIGSERATYIGRQD